MDDPEDWCTVRCSSLQQQCIQSANELPCARTQGSLSQPVDDNATREGVADVACQLELGMAGEDIDGAMLALYENIGRLSHEQYCNPQFLAECAPDTFASTFEQAHQPRQVHPLHTRLDSLQPPTVFLLTSTNPRTKQQWTEAFQQLDRKSVV